MSFYISHRGIYGNSYEMLDALFWIDDRLSAEAVVELLHFLKRHYRNSPEEEKTPVQWRIKDLLPEGGSLVLSGAGGTGKTLTAYAMAYAIATGQPFLGKETVEGRILVCQAEDAELNKQNMLKVFGGDEQLFEDMVTWIPGFNLEEVETELAYQEYGLFICDNLTTIQLDNVAVKENETGYAKVIRQITAITNKTKTNLCLIHHTSKNNDSTGIKQVRGSGAITEAVSTVMVLKTPVVKGLFARPEEDLESNERILEVVKQRVGAKTKIKFEIDFDSFTWNYISSGNELTAEEKLTLSTVEKQAEILLSTHPDGLTSKQIQQVLGCDYKHLSKTLKQSRTIKSRKNGTRFNTYYLDSSSCNLHSHDSNSKTLTTKDLQYILSTKQERMLLENIQDRDTRYTEDSGKPYTGSVSDVQSCLQGKQELKQDSTREPTTGSVATLEEEIPSETFTEDDIKVLKLSGRRPIAKDSYVKVYEKDSSCYQLGYVVKYVQGKNDKGQLTDFVIVRHECTNELMKCPLNLVDVVLT